MVLNEIERVDAAISGVLPETPGVKIRSVLPAIIGLTPAMYLGEDKIHLSDAGLKALCSYIINILDEEQQGGEAEGREGRDEKSRGEEEDGGRRKRSTNIKIKVGFKNII